MENPFEIIIERLERIENLLETVYATNNKKQNTILIPTIMNVKQVASYLSLTPSAIYKFTSSKDIPHSKRGKRLYFEKTVIDEWILENKQLTNSDIEKIAADYLIKRRLK